MTDPSCHTGPAARVCAACAALPESMSRALGFDAESNESELTAVTLVPVDETEDDAW